MVKLVWFVRFFEGLDRDAAWAHWRERHGPLGSQVLGIEHYVQNHVVASVGPDGATDEPVLFDGLSECWFEDRAAFNQAIASPEWLAMNAGAENLFGLDFSLEGMSAVVEEHMVAGERSRA